MARLSRLLLCIAATLQYARCQDLQDGDSPNAVPLWGLSTEIHGGQSHLCNKTFADANATGIFYVNPNVAQGPQAGQQGNYNGSTLNSGMAVTIYNPGFSNASNASSSYSLWYNTNGANYSNNYALGYDVCALSGFSFNYNTQLRGQSDNGSCLSALDQPCISAIKASVQQSATWLTTPNGETPSNLTRSSLPGVCRDLSHMLVKNMPSECSYFFQDKLDGLAWPLTSFGASYQTGLYDNCRLNGTWQNALSFYNNASRSTYTSWMRSVTPLIFVWMPVADAQAQTVITETVAELFCGHVNEISDDSFHPPAAPAPTPVAYVDAPSSNNTILSASSPPAADAGSSLSGGAIAGIVIGGIAVLAILAGLALFLRRKKQRSKHVQEPTDAYSDKPSYGRSELPGEHARTQLPATEEEGGRAKRYQLDGTEIRELDGKQTLELEGHDIGDGLKKADDPPVAPVELPAS